MSYYGVCTGCLEPMAADGWTCDLQDPESTGTGMEPCSAGPFCPTCRAEHLEFEHGVNFKPGAGVYEAPPDDEEEG